MAPSRGDGETDGNGLKTSHVGVLGYRLLSARIAISTSAISQAVKSTDRVQNAGSNHIRPPRLFWALEFRWVRFGYFHFW